MVTEFVSAVPIIPARDIEASTSWYREELGFDVLHVEPVEDRRHVDVADPAEPHHRRSSL